MPNHFHIKIRRGPRRKWTPEKFALARNMRLSGANNIQISHAIGLSEGAISTKLSGIPMPTKSGGWRMLYVSGEGRPSDKLIAARDAQIAATLARNEAAENRGDLSHLIGDMPPPGRSALDKRRARA